MEKIKFEITEKDIKEYLENLKKKNPEYYEEYFKHKEAIFLQYMKSQSIMTQEALEIIMNKYNFDDTYVDGTYSYKETGIVSHNRLNSFTNYFFGIKNLDINGLCHILIPALRYYNEDKKEISFDQLYGNLGIVADKINIPMNNPSESLINALSNYKLCKKVELQDNIIFFTMSREYSEKELLIYQNLYDEDKVKKIRKIVRESK